MKLPAHFYIKGNEMSLLFCLLSLSLSLSGILFVIHYSLNLYLVLKENIFDKKVMIVCC